MSEKHHRQLRLCLTGLVTLLEVAHLVWQHFHGGVVSHHLLNRRDMPAISNWWGMLLLPSLTWYLVGRIQRRLAIQTGADEGSSKLPVRVLAAFVGSLLLGILLSVSFARHYESVTLYLFGGVLLTALLLPVYRAEYVLGFVLGMSATFGGVLPVIISCVIGAGSAVTHALIRAVARLWRPARP